MYTYHCIYILAGDPPPAHHYMDMLCIYMFSRENSVREKTEFYPRDRLKEHDVPMDGFHGTHFTCWVTSSLLDSLVDLVPSMVATLCPTPPQHTLPRGSLRRLPYYQGMISTIRWKFLLKCSLWYTASLPGLGGPGMRLSRHALQQVWGI